MPRQDLTSDFDISALCPEGDRMQTAAEIQQMFDRVARRYDFLNHALCGGIDNWWRRVLANRVRQQRPTRLLDLATGSGDVLLALQQAGAAEEYVGADFCFPMLQVARRKGLHDLIMADGLQLPFPDETFQAITISFGFRNWVDRPAGLREMARVLTRGGQLYMLEFSQPWVVLRPAYYFYLRHFLPSLAKLFGAEARDYRYLCDSIQAFPSPETLGGMIREAGFGEVTWQRLTFGVVALHWARKG